MPCLVLDAMGVIFEAADDVAELLIPFIAEQAPGTSDAEVQSAYLAASLGEIDADAFWQRMGVAADLEDDYLGLRTLNPGLIELLDHARQAGIPVGCLSNDIGRWSAKLRERLGVETYLEHATISGDVGLRKPDPRIYQAFIDASGYPAAELLFVDDRAKNVDAARALGIQSLIFTRHRGFDPVYDWLEQLSG